MDIVISGTSDKPIYEQIVTQVRGLICSGALAEGEQLPSMRVLANDLHVSVITTKRAYADLEAVGLVRTVPGRGCFVAGASAQLVREEGLRTVEDLLGQAVLKGREMGLTNAEISEMLSLQLED